MIAWLPVAAAHPIGSTFATQSTTLLVHPDHVEVEYAAEVPDDILRPRGAEPDPVQAMAVELGAGLVLQVDDVVVPMARLDDAPAPRAGSRHTTVFSQHLTAPLPPGATRIRVSTTNLLETSNLYENDVKLEPVFRVASCSLLATRDGRVVRDDSNRWLREEEARSVEVTLASRTPALVGWLLGRGTEPVRSGLLWAKTGLDALAPPAMDTAGLAAVLGGAALLGLASGTRERAWWGWSLAALGPPLAFLPGGWAELGGSVVALALAALGRTPWAVGAAVATLSATTHAARAAVLVAAVGLATAAAGRGSPRAARVLAGLLALVLLGRGLLGSR